MQEHGGSYTVRLEPDAVGFPAAPGQTLLAAALAAGIDMPSSCRAGTCRTCIAKLVAGEVAYTVEWPGLIPEERAEGLILPCVTLARSDLVVERTGHQSLPVV